MAHSASDTLSSTQHELEKLVSDLRGLISSRDLDSVPEIRALRQRLDDGMQVVRESTVRAAQEAARQAKDAAQAADRYAHDEPWQVAGAALAVGAVVGFLLSRRKFALLVWIDSMDWLSLLGLGAFVDRWRSYVIEAAIAAEDRSTLFRLELREYKRSLAALIGLSLGLAALSVVMLTVLSCAIVVQFWDTPDRAMVAWSVAGAWIAIWLVATVFVVSLARKAGNGFAMTRKELANDWTEIKEQL